MLQSETKKLSSLIKAAKHYGRFYCKFISANDVDLTGAHQVGLYIAKNAWGLFFEQKGEKGENKEKFIQVHVNGCLPFTSRVIYYGKGTRNEYRITRFWKDSPFNKTEQVGNLIVFIPMSEEDYQVHILDTDVEIERFIEEFSLSLLQNNAVFEDGKSYELDLSRKLTRRVEEAIEVIDEFPTTTNMAALAREIHKEVYRKKHFTPDNFLLEWIKTEYITFKALERKLYIEYISKIFGDIDPLVAAANTILNRRKSRAGKSLEHHVDFLFSSYNIPFSHPGQSEGKKQPDFLLPSNTDYANKEFPAERLMFMGAKTTCKDRWRQILNEANRIPQKHLLTLQQGISPNQLDEMAEENVILVVPEPYHGLYPENYRDRLWTVTKFIQFAEEKYSIK